VLLTPKRTEDMDQEGGDIITLMNNIVQVQVQEKVIDLHDKLQELHEKTIHALGETVTNSIKQLEQDFEQKIEAKVSDKTGTLLAVITKFQEERMEADERDIQVLRSETKLFVKEELGGQSVTGGEPLDGSSKVG